MSQNNPATPEAGSDASAELREILRQVRELLPKARKAIASARSMKELEEVRVDFLGKKGALAPIQQGLGKLSKEEKPVAGKVLNDHKGKIVEEMNRRRDELEARELQEQIEAEAIDITLPGVRPPRGTLHPVTQVTREVTKIFRDMGFRVEHGPEIESEWLNFDALNMFEDHPARDMQDTLYVERGYVLRTHTSPNQIRAMRKLKTPPMAVVTPGRVYRHDSDATHSPMFHQMEGFLVDRDISMGHLKGVLNEFLRGFFGREVKSRFRPSFFPFTEPSAEVDIWSDELGWLEVLGCGMIHPDVLRNGGIDPEEYTGFAFGLGLDRMAMLKFGISDLRLMFENDLRFLRQF